MAPDGGSQPRMRCREAEQRTAEQQNIQPQNIEG
jgi:hypothetical protein